VYGIPAAHTAKTETQINFLVKNFANDICEASGELPG
jgi:hypothetical protein